MCPRLGVRFDQRQRPEARGCEEADAHPPINDEITKREPYDGYLVYQGGVPEVEEFVKKVRK